MFLKQKQIRSNEEIFVVISMAYMGDSLVLNSLFQNIKILYPNAKTVFIINKPYYDIAKYQKDVDEVYVYDKNNEHKGILGVFKFIKQFPYKKIKYVFKICKKTRVDILAMLFHPEKIISYKETENIPTHERYSNLLKEITKKNILNLPIKYNADINLPVKFQNIIFKNKKYIALCSTSSAVAKDMPVQTVAELIKTITHDDFEVLFVGVGKKARSQSDELKRRGCKFIDLVDKTSIYELAQCLRNSKALISVDTGTMHLGYANDVPTVCVFYIKEYLLSWAPDKNLYPHTIVTTDNTVENIYKVCRELV